MDSKPTTRPLAPFFSSGPCRKRPGWEASALSHALVGRSHRSQEGKERLQTLIDMTRKLHNIPADYRVGITPGSTTGAMEMAMWNLLGPRGVDVYAADVFGYHWVRDILEELKLEDARAVMAPFGEMPTLATYNPINDTVFVWNATTAGTIYPNADWIDDRRGGLTVCDACSAAFGCELPWEKLDVTVFSWQKNLGGEAGFGMIVLSPRAIERITSYKPSWPIPRLFRLLKNDMLMDSFFRGETLNTPSMLAAEDCLDALLWYEKNGGLGGAIKRIDANYKAIKAWVEGSSTFEFVVKDEAIRSKMAVTLALKGDGDKDWIKYKAIATCLAQEGVAYDILGHADASRPHLRIWAGATIDTQDIVALLPWIDWAYGK